MPPNQVKTQCTSSLEREAPLLCMGSNETTSRSASDASSEMEDTPVFRDTLIQPNDTNSAALRGTTLSALDIEKKPNKLATVKTLDWQKTLSEHLKDEEHGHFSLPLRNALSSSSQLLSLVTGSRGSGKSRLALQLATEAATYMAQNMAPRTSTFLENAEDTLGTVGMVLVGRPNPRTTSVPYAPIVSAIERWVIEVQQQPESYQIAVRKHILSGIEEPQVLATVIPALKWLLVENSSDEHGNDKENDVAQHAEIIQRWVFQLRNFLRAICQVHPVVLVLDDMHEFDQCTLHLLGFILQDTTKCCNTNGKNRLVLVGTVNVDEVTADSFLSRTLREWQDQRETQIIDAQLKPLTLESTTLFLQRLFTASPAHSVKALGVWVHRHTAGNLSVLVGWLNWIRARDLVTFDSRTKRWTWEVDEMSLELESHSKKVDDDQISCAFLRQRLLGLSKSLKEILMAAAAMGLEVNSIALERILGLDSATPYLNQAVELGIMVLDTNGYVFESNGMRQSIYELVPIADREQFHLEIGRRLWRKMKSNEELDAHIFTILSHMRIGQTLITRPAEKEKVAFLCHSAGTKAVQCSTFRVARIYLKFGVSLLCKENSWKKSYELTLALYTGAAETEMVFGNFEEMDELLEEIFANSCRFEDTLPAKRIKIYALNVNDQQLEALELGLEVLKGLDETFPDCLVSGASVGSVYYCMKLWQESTKVKRLIGRKRDDQLLRLPPLTDKQKFQALSVLQLMVVTSLLRAPQLAPFIILRMVRITLVYGTSTLAAAAFATYGIVLSASDNASEAVRFGELALKALEKRYERQYFPRVYAAYYGVVWCWKKPIKEVLTPLLTAYRVGMQNGDSEFSSLCGDLYLLHAFETDMPLDVLEREWAGFFDMLVSRRQATTIKMTLPWAQVIHHFMGLSQDALSSKGDLIDYDGTELAGAPCCAKDTIRITRIILHYAMADYAGAFEHAEKLFDLSLLPPAFSRVSGALYPALAALAMARISGTGKSRALRQARKAVRLFRKWVNCSPFNCLDKLFLLEAEIASLRGNYALALKKYICSISVSGENGFLLINGLANERLARHLLWIGERELVRGYFEKAIEVFERWGASAKVVRLQAEMDDLCRT